MEGYEFIRKSERLCRRILWITTRGTYRDAGDLYVKKTAESEKLVRQYDYSSSVSTFESQTEPLGVWYEIFGGWCEEYEARYQKLQIESLRAENVTLKEKNEHLLDHMRHETITTEGTVCIEVVSGRHYNSWEINTSSILTKLIQEAGRWCESYASDLFIRWGVIQKGLENATVEPGKRSGWKP